MIEIKIYGEAADVMAELRSLAGSVGGAPAENPNAPAAKATRQPKATQEAASSAAPSTAAGASETSSAPTPATVAPAQTETPVSSPSDAPVTEADLIAAANAAAATGVNPGKIQAYIRENYTKADGTPGTLKGTAPDQQPRLLADLQKIARKELAL